MKGILHNLRVAFGSVEQKRGVLVYVLWRTVGDSANRIEEYTELRKMIFRFSQKHSLRSSGMIREQVFHLPSDIIRNSRPPVPSSMSKISPFISRIYGGTARRFFAKYKSYPTRVVVTDLVR